MSKPTITIPYPPTKTAVLSHPLKDAEGKYTCAQCGKRAEWGDSWMGWYESPKHRLEDAPCEFAVCSAECALLKMPGIKIPTVIEEIRGKSMRHKK